MQNFPERSLLMLFNPRSSANHANSTCYVQNVNWSSEAAVSLFKRGEMFLKENPRSLATTCPPFTKAFHICQTKDIRRHKQWEIEDQNGCEH